MSVLKTLLAGVCCAALCFACSDSSTASGTSGTSSSAFPASPLATVTSAGGALTIEIRTRPAQPPSRGTCEAEYRVLDAVSGEPVDGLSLEVVPWMVSMGHGSSGKPTIAAQGDGRYVVSKLSLYMAGRWELRTTFSGSRADSAAPAIDVE